MVIEKLRSLSPRKIALQITIFAVSSICLAIILFHWSYSKSEITGYAVKISEPVKPCSAWIAEIQLLQNPGTQIAETFSFSTEDNAIISNFNSYIGKKVIVSYEKRLVLPIKCIEDSRYIAVAVTPMSSKRKK